MRKRKHKKLKTKVRIFRFIKTIIIVLFTVALFAMFWKWILKHAITVVIITGGLIIIFIIVGHYAIPKEIKRRFKREMRI